jgi:hypothetical protein
VRVTAREFIEIYDLVETLGFSELYKSEAARFWKIEVVPRFVALCPTVMLDRGYFILGRGL